MTVQQQITTYLSTQPERKRADMQALHTRIKKLLPRCRLWFFDGKNESGKVVMNPSIGYGVQQLTYADGSTKEFYQIGISGNTSGISVYLLGLADRKHLAATYGKTLGKASVTGYCIKFKTLSDINIDVLEAAMRYAIRQTTR